MLTQADIARRIRVFMITRGHPYPGQKYTHGWKRVGVDLAAAVKSGVASSQPLSGGLMGTVELITHNNGTRTVRKKLEDVSDTFGDAFPPKRQADAEELSAVLGGAIGAPVPKVLRTAVDEVHIEYVQGDPGYAVTDHELAPVVSSPEGIRLGVFDILTGNWDRASTSNWRITPDDKPVGIDHSFLFNDGYAADEPPGLDSIGPFAIHFVRSGSGPKGRNGRPPVDWDNNPLTPADIDWLRRRLAAVKDDFDRLGRDDWWEFASARLEAIAPYATGTKARFAR